MDYKEYFSDFYSFIFFVSFLLTMVCVYFYRRKVQPIDIWNDHSYLWERVVAFLLDTAICYLLVMCIIKCFSLINIEVKQLYWELVLIIVYWLYFSLLESSKYQATVGKIIQRIYVSDIYGKKIGFNCASIRIFVKFVSFIPFCIGYLMVFSNKYRRAFHDIITNTIVLKKR